MTRDMAAEDRIDDIIDRTENLLYKLLYRPDDREAFEDAEERLLRVLELAEDVARQLPSK